MSAYYVQDIVPATPLKAHFAKTRLQAFGIDRFDVSRLTQLHLAIDHPASIWASRSLDEKDQIKADVCQTAPNTFH